MVRNMRWRAILTLGMLVCAIRAFMISTPQLPSNYRNDAIAFVHIDADVLLQGRNPYTADDAFWAAVRRWPLSYATPVFGSTNFGDDPIRYPTAEKLGFLLHQQAEHPESRTNDFDPRTVHNYPAGIILLAAPFIWAGIPSLIYVNILLFALLIALIVWRAPKDTRPGLVIAIAANPAFILYGLFVNIDTACILFVVAAWHWFKHGKTSGLLMGLACSTKQLAWFIAPFYLLEVGRREGMRAVLIRGSWLLGGFLLPNLPFIIASPKAWFDSIMIPMVSPMFPLGFGPITLALSEAVPFGQPRNWTILVFGIWGLLFLFQWLRHRITVDGIILAIVPLWFSWRSPINYFSLIPAIAAWMAVMQMLVETQKRKQQWQDYIWRQHKHKKEEARIAMLSPSSKVAIGGNTIFASTSNEE
jgi:hypothetical protein